MKPYPADETNSLFSFARLFAILDAIIVAGQIPNFYEYAAGSVDWNRTSVFLLLTFLAVAVSAVLWWWQLPGRFLLTYLLFPVRIITAALSVAWLANLALTIYPSTGMFHHVTWCFAIAIEIARLLTTIWLHRVCGVAPQDLTVRSTTEVTARDPHSLPSVK